MTSKTTAPSAPADAPQADLAQADLAQADLAQADLPLSGQAMSISPSISIRHEIPRDDPWVEDLHGVAFGPGRFARTAFRVRERFPHDPALSLIAEYEGRPIGSVRMTPVSVGEIQGYLLGPLATDPDYRNKGAGRALVQKVTEMSLEGGAEFILLVGDAPYYQPLGYEPAASGAIVFPGPVDPARILVRCRNRELLGRLAGKISAA